MTILKRKSFYVLVVAMVLCLVMAFVPFTSKTALAAISDPSISSEFTVKGAYVQLELGAEENPDAHTGKIALNFVATISQSAYEAAVAQGELKLGLLVGPTSRVASATNYTTAIEAGFKAISYVGSANSGASQEIVFTDGVAEIEAGIVFDETKLGDQLLDASGLDLSAIPFITYVGENVEDASDDVNIAYIENAVDRAARPIVHEMYIRSSNFDYEAYPDDENKPVKISIELEKKFVVNVTDNSKYRHQQAGAEIYLDSVLQFMWTANEDNTLTQAANLLSTTYLSWGINNNNEKVYLAGNRHYGTHKTGNYNGYFNTSNPFSGYGNLMETNGIITKAQYTYGLTVFHNAGTNKGKVETFTFKAPTLVISSAGSGTTGHFVGPYDGGSSSFNSVFGNSIASASDRYLQREIDGYYILANDITYTASQGYCYTGITNHVNRVDDVYTNKNLLNDGTKGFTGVFDGRGFAIYDGLRQGVGTSTNSSASNKSMFNYGLGMFTWINGGTVKNLSFFNITLASQSLWGSVLAYSITGNSLIENVYIRPLVNAMTSVNPNGMTIGHGSLLAQNIKDSTLRNVIVENDFMDANDEEINHGLNNYQLFDVNRTTNNVMENVISLGNSPVSWETNKGQATLTMSVNEMPVIDDAGTTATPGVAYLLGENPVLRAQFGEQVTFILNECYGPAQNLEGYAGYVADKETDEISVTFKYNIAGVQQFSGYRDLASYVTNPENEAVKTALVNSGFYNVAESGFVTPKHIPNTVYTSNNRTTGFGFGNRVDDAIIVVFSRFNNNSNPLYTDNYANEFIMADENGKFYVDFSKYVSSIGSTGRVWVEYSYADVTGQSLPTVATYDDCCKESFVVEVPAYDVTFQRISRAS